MSRPLRTTLPAIVTALGLGLATPPVLAATGPRDPVGLATAPWVLAQYGAPPDAGLPPPPSKPPPKKDGSGGGGIAGAPPPPTSAPPPPSGGPPPSAPPPANLQPGPPPTPPVGAPGGSPSVPPGGPPSVGAPGAPTPPTGSVPTPPGGSAPTPPDAGIDQPPKADDAALPEDGKKDDKKDDKKDAEQPVPPQTPSTPPSQPPSQAPSQWQQWPYPYPPPHIVVSPQIQVQVNPTMDVQANPKSNANAKADAKADAQANPNATAGANIDTTIDTKSTGQQGDASGAGTSPTPAPGVQDQVLVPPPHSDRDPLAGWKTPRRGALITGLVLFGISYGSSAFSGYKLRNGCGTSNDFVGCRRTAKNMFIPVVGPALNIRTSGTATTQFAMAFASGAQATGALLTVIGAMIVYRDRRHNRRIEEAAGVRLSDRVSIGSGFGARGGQVQLTARF